MVSNSCVLRSLISCLAAVALVLPGVASADETTRQVQEELRRRRLFNGDIDGEQTPELGMALKRYQERKGFPASGVVDAQTLRSMGIADGPSEQVPVLRSEAAIAPDADREGGDAVGPPMSIAGDINVPPPSREELWDLMRRYLEACETDSVSDELGYLAPRVDYFNHGIVTKTYVRNRLVEYNEHWPQRKYVMPEEITLTKRGDNTAATARLAFELANPAANRKANGSVDHTIVVARRPDLGFEIVGVQESRVKQQRQTSRRRTSRKRGSSGPRLTPLDRTLRKMFSPPQRSSRRR